MQLNQLPITLQRRPITILYPDVQLKGQRVPLHYLAVIVQLLKIMATCTNSAKKTENGNGNAPGQINFTPWSGTLIMVVVLRSLFQAGAKMIQERTRYVDMMSVQGPGS